MTSNVYTAPDAKIIPTGANPDRAEMALRVARVREMMAAQQLDFYLCHDPANSRYLSNFTYGVHERPFIILVPASGPLIFLMPKLEKSHVQLRVIGDFEFVEYFEFPAPKGELWSDRLRDIIKSTHRVGVEASCPLSVYREIPGTAVLSDIVDDVRQIKSAYEIARVAYSSQWVSEAHANLLANAKAGASVLGTHTAVVREAIGKVLASVPDANILACEVIAVAWPPSISHDPHQVPPLAATMVEGGPHVTVVNGKANGYGAEVERTFFINHVPDAAIKPFNVMLQARALAFELAVPGANMSEVDRRVNALIAKHGYGDDRLHRTGHSFGVTGHEGPFLAEGYDHEIQPGMCFSIEPGIYLPGIGGFRFSDTVLITDTGNRALTYAPETLEELTHQR